MLVILSGFYYADSYYVIILYIKLNDGLFYLQVGYCSPT